MQWTERKTAAESNPQPLECGLGIPGSRDLIARKHAVELNQILG